MNNPISPTAPAQVFTDTERLDFLSRQSVKFESKTPVDSDYYVQVFPAKGVKVFSGATARDAIDSAMRGSST